MKVPNIYRNEYSVIVALALVFLIIIMVQMYTVFQARDDDLYKDDDDPLIPGVYLWINETTTLSGRDIRMEGDIVVNEGAVLTLEDCNLTGGGILKVSEDGKAVIKGCGLRDTEGRICYRCFETAGIEPITFALDLKNASDARMDFDTKYELRKRRSFVFVEVNVSGTWTPLSCGGMDYSVLERDYGFTGSAPRWEQVSFDLDPYAGSEMDVRIRPELYSWDTEGYFMLDKLRVQGQGLPEDLGNTVDYDTYGRGTR